MTDRIDPKRAAEVLRELPEWTQDDPHTEEMPYIEYAAALCEREALVQGLLEDIRWLPSGKHEDAPLDDYLAAVHRTADAVRRATP